MVQERDKNLIHQANEYERRLDELNHAHAQQVQRNADFISREVYDSRHGTLMGRVDLIERHAITRDAWESHRNAIEVRFANLDSSIDTRCSTVDKRLNEFDNWRSRMTGVVLGIAAGAGLIGGGLVSFFARLLK